ncbi:hypothetical protein [Alkalibacterium sp. 20]|uniref:hypothetical protein n=1 Tax=Alkalibacterium sp. 20 TaxID=1798803 RepID=UPI00091FDE69|nr:hypothetical protein [Alkalibacterium sp. 20]OJF94675.1 hypothetical protein AX762_07275 [Alkalibacterium sp. 20]
MKCKNYVKKHNLVNKVLFYGLQDGEELNEIYDECELALDSMGRHRSKVYYNSSLKGKEYGAKGLPIVSGMKTELDFDGNYPYYLRVPADDTPINIENIINFYDSIYDSSLDTQKEVINYIRDYTIKHFGVGIGLRKVLDVILNDEN